MSSKERRAAKTVFKKHRGAAASVARELSIGMNTVSDWFKGRTISARIEAAVKAKLIELEGSSEATPEGSLADLPKTA